MDTCKIFTLALLAWFFIMRAPDGVELTFGPYDTVEACEEVLATANEMVGQHKGWLTTGCVVQKVSASRTI